MTETFIALAPYLSGVLTVGLGFLTYHEAKRKTKHDEMHDLYDEMKKERDDAKAENVTVRQALDDETAKNVTLTTEVSKLKAENSRLRKEVKA